MDLNVQTFDSWKESVLSNTVLISVTCVILKKKDAESALVFEQFFLSETNLQSIDFETNATRSGNSTPMMEVT